VASVGEMAVGGRGIDDAVKPKYLMMCVCGRYCMRTLSMGWNVFLLYYSFIILGGDG